jgi:ADP-ribosylglycohydrolase
MGDRRSGKQWQEPARSATQEDPIAPTQRVVGCFLGGAVGDALGAEVEFLRIDQIRDDYGPPGVLDLPVEGGAITDDTQMTLFTAEGLVAAGDTLRSGYLSLVAPYLHAAYRRWLHTQARSHPAPGPSPAILASGALADRTELYAVREPGNTCLTALLSGRRGSLATAINDSKGCGGTMRVAPVGLVDEIDPFTLGAEAASITHGHPSAFLSAGAFALIIADVFTGRPLDAAAEHAVDVLARYPRNDETSLAVLAALDLARSEPEPTPELVERLGGGWVGEEALAIALYAALTADSFEAGVRTAVNHSGDSDSTGAIAGNLLGTHLGRTAIPDRWIRSLAERDLVESVAADFARQVLGLASPGDDGVIDLRDAAGG